MAIFTLSFIIIFFSLVFAASLLPGEAIIVYFEN